MSLEKLLAKRRKEIAKEKTQRRTEIKRARREEAKTQVAVARAGVKTQIAKAKEERAKIRRVAIARRIATAQKHAQTAHRATVKAGRGIRSTYRGYKKVRKFLGGSKAKKKKWIWQ